MKTIISSLALAMCFSLSANASSVIKTGLYKQSSYGNETWNIDTSRPNFELQNLGNGQVVIKELGKLKGMPLVMACFLPASISHVSINSCLLGRLRFSSSFRR